MTASKVGSAAINTAQIAIGAVDALRLATTGTPAAPGQVLGYSAGGLTWTAPFGGGGIWALNGTSAYYNGGSVGIGTAQPSAALHVKSGGLAVNSSSTYSGAGKGTFLEFLPGIPGIGRLYAYDQATNTAFNLSLNGPGGNVGIGTGFPKHRLTIDGGPSWTTEGWLGSIEMVNGAAIGWNANAGGQRFGMGHSTSGFGLFRTASDPGTTGSAPTYDLFVNDTGRVGIGTTTPRGALHVASGGLAITGASSPYGGGQGLFLERNGALANVFAFDYASGPLPLCMNAPGGNVGIGTGSPIVKLDVVGTGVLESRVASGNERAILSLDSTLGGSRRVWTLESGVFGTSGLFGIYDRTGNRAGLTIDTAGVVSVNVLRINGADVAEPFDIADGELPKGTVVVIDPVRHGSLRRSTRKYDTCVAGIVSGANGVETGIILSQTGVNEGGQNVAISGRVYARAEARNAPIQPGDLLTTSDTPGHAMKVTDHTRAQGAVIGKAMSSLDEGTGMVLVLVTLQ